MNDSLYVLSLGNRVCVMHENSVSLIKEPSNATKFSTIGDAMRKASYLMNELKTNVFIRKL